MDTVGEEVRNDVTNHLPYTRINITCSCNVDCNFSGSYVTVRSKKNSSDSVMPLYVAHEPLVVL